MIGNDDESKKAVLSCIKENRKFKDLSEYCCLDGLFDFTSEDGKKSVDSYITSGEWDVSSVLKYFTIKEPVLEELGLDFDRFCQSSEVVKNKLSADGSDFIEFSCSCGDYELDFEYSRGELNDALIESGILGEYLEEVNRFISAQIERDSEMYKNFDLVILGGVHRIPLLQTSLEKKKKDLTGDGKLLKMISDAGGSWGAYYTLLRRALTVAFGCTNLSTARFHRLFVKAMMIPVAKLY